MGVAFPAPLRHPRARTAHTAPVYAGSRRPPMRPCPVCRPCRPCRAGVRPQGQRIAWPTSPTPEGSSGVAPGPSRRVTFPRPPRPRLPPRQLPRRPRPRGPARRLSPRVANAPAAAPGFRPGQPPMGPWAITLPRRRSSRTGQIRGPLFGMVPRIPARRRIAPGSPGQPPADAPRRSTGAAAHTTAPVCIIPGRGSQSARRRPGVPSVLSVSVRGPAHIHASASAAGKGTTSPPPVILSSALTARFRAGSLLRM